MKLINKILIFGVLFSLILSSLTYGQVKDKITLAVMDFKNNSSTMRYDRLQRAIPEMLKTELSRYSEISVVERKKIESIIKEQTLVQAGFVDEKQAQEVGRLAGAEYLIIGEINTTSGQLRIDAHLIKVATGQILGEKVTGKNEKQIEEMIKLLANNFIFDLTGSGERKEFEKITQYHSKWFLVSTGALAITTTVFHFMYKSNYDNYHKTNQFDKFDYYYDRANRNYKARNILMLLTSASALTTFILWQSDKSEGNKIYASKEKSILNKTKGQLALGVLPKNDGWLLSINFRF